jgi:hypothetical protein
LIVILPTLSLLSGLFLSKLLEKSKKSWFLVIIVLSISFVTLYNTTDTVAYFTPFVGSKIGGDITGDSNIDWGQSLPVLRSAKLKIDYISSSTPVDIKMYGINAQTLLPSTPKKLLKNKNILISRSSYFKQRFYQDFFFSESKAKFVANNTYLLFTP